MNGKTMSATNDNMKARRALSDLIRGEIGRQANRRHLIGLPAFAPDCALPDRFAALLQEIDRAESEADGSAS